MKSKSQKTPISAHPAFSPIVALWFAAFLGLGSLIIPVILYEKIFSVTGVSSVVSAASPPLGMTARLLIAFVAAMGGAVLGFFLARKVGSTQANAHPSPRSAKPKRSKSNKLSKSLRDSIKRPISAREELGSKSLDEPVASEGTFGSGSIKGRRRALSITDDSGPSDYFGSAPLPGGDTQLNESANTDIAVEIAPEIAPDMAASANRNDEQFVDAVRSDAHPHNPFNHAAESDYGAAPVEMPEDNSPFANLAGAGDPHDLNDPIETPAYAEAPSFGTAPSLDEAPTFNEAPAFNDAPAKEEFPEEFKAPEFAAPAPDYNPIPSDAADHASLPETQVEPNPSSHSVPFMHEEQAEMSDNFNNSNGHNNPNEAYNPFSSHAANAHSMQAPFTPPPVEDAAPFQQDSVQPQESIQAPIQAPVQEPVSEAPAEVEQAGLAGLRNEAMTSNDICSALKAVIKDDTVVEDETPVQSPASFGNQPPVENQASIESQAPVESTILPGKAAAHELRNRPIDDLGMVELVERFAVALQSADEDASNVSDSTASTPAAPTSQAQADSTFGQQPFAAPDIAPDTAPAAPFAQLSTAVPDITPAVPAAPAASVTEPTGAPMVFRRPEHDLQPNAAPQTPLENTPLASAPPANTPLESMPAVAALTANAAGTKPAQQSEQSGDTAGHNLFGGQSPLQASSQVPASLQPLGYDEYGDEDDIDDVSNDLDGLTLDLSDHLAADIAQPSSYVPDLGQTNDQAAEQVNTQINEQVDIQALQQVDEQVSQQASEQQIGEEGSDEAYSSLLEMKSPFGNGQSFPRIEEEADGQSEYAEPVVVFPGQEQRRAMPASDGPVRDPLPQGREHLNPRPFDGPSQAGVATNGTPDPAACHGDTERSLREALEKLQRMGGAS